jgi:hypothetical protein
MFVPGLKQVKPPAGKSRRHVRRQVEGCKGWRPPLPATADTVHRNAVPHPCPKVRGTLAAAMPSFAASFFLARRHSSNVHLKPLPSRLIRG